MAPLTTPLVAILLSSYVSAWQIPFLDSLRNAVPSTASPEQHVVEQPQHQDTTTRIAIIGAGAGGSSAAFWISLAKERLGADVEVDVFERLDYIGGRSTTVHPYEDPSIPAKELGASIFVDANKNLMRAVREFNLTLQPLHDDTGMGIWDGQQFVVTTYGGWWDTAKLVWRYGYFGPKRAMDEIKSFLTTFVRQYNQGFPSWGTLQDLTDTLNFTTILSQNTAQYFESLGVSPLFVREMIEAATRVNYAQDVTSIHALGGSVSMSADDAHQVKGGNFLIFEQFLKRSQARVHLKTTVTGLTKAEVSGRTRWTVATLSPDFTPPLYDHVILAAPFHSSAITLLGSDAIFPPVEYVHLHVTLLSSSEIRPQPAYFGSSGSSSLPGMILTTAEGLRNGGPAPEFQSISYHSTFTRNGKTEHVFKIFSMDRKDDEWIAKVFGEGNVGWVLRKEWDSYPKLPTTSTFPPIKADDGLWYVNSLEPWVSTMETETLSSRNIVERLFQEAFGQGICPKQDTSNEHSSEGSSSEELLAGWDCQVPAQEVAGEA